MKQTSSRAVRDGLKYINEIYGFMLARGYEILSVDDGDVGWRGVLRRAGLLVKVERSRGDDYVYFRTAAQPPEEWTDIGSVVYAATGEKVPLYDSDAKKLQQYLDRVESYFEGEYIRNPDSLEAARQGYRESYRAPLPQVQTPYPTEPKEQKRIAILYYPLMAIIVLLLFGALTTLYTVLLDRLFSAFSLQADSYFLFMGVGAVLLAIGTLLLIRKWVKFVG